MADNTITARELLYGKTNKGRGSIDGMRGDFAEKLATMMSDPAAPKGLGIYSGYRSPDRQAEIIRDNAGKYGLDGNAWMADVEALGPIEAGQKWASDFRSSGMSKNIGKPGGSNHQHGSAADLSYNGQSLKHAPKEVVEWVHGNAERYGLKFPLDNENWHVEDSSTRGGVVNSVAEQALKNGGYADAKTPYRELTNPADPKPWYEDAGPQGTYQAHPSALHPSWSDVGGAVVRSMPTTQFAQWGANREAAPDMSFLNNPSVEKFGKTLDGLNPDERDYVLENAHSMDHAVSLRSQIDTQKQDSTTFGNSSTAFPAALLANIVDPVSLQAGGFAGKAFIAGSNALRASSSAGIITRMLEGGAIALTDATMASGIQAQVDPNFGLDDFAFNALTAAGLGTGFGVFGRGAELDAVSGEASAFFGNRARNLLADTIEKKGYTLSPRTQDFLRPQNRLAAAGAAENLAGDAAKFTDRRGRMEVAADWLTKWTSNDTLLRTKAGSRAADIYKALMPDLSRTGGREMRGGESAWENMQRNHHTDVSTMEHKFQQSLDAYMAEGGAAGKQSWWKRDQAEAEFSSRVETAIYDPATARGSKAVEDMAEHYRQGFKQKLKEAKESGAEWAQDIPEDMSYVPFVVDKNAYYTTVSRIGRSGLVDVVKQAFLAAQPALARVEKRVSKAQWVKHNKAVAAGEAVERPVAKPLKEGTKAHAKEKASRDARVTRMAEHYVEMIENTKIDNNNAERMVALSGDSERALREMLDDMKLDKEEIDNFLKEFGYTQKSGPTNFRRRAALERNRPFIPSQFADKPDAAKYAVSLRDLTARDIRATYERYTRSINGQLALVRNGFRSEADARKQIMEATTFRTNVEVGENGQQNVFKADLDTAARELNYHIDRILGKPAFPGFSPKARLAINLIKSVNFIRFMQQSGIAQLGDAPKIALRYGAVAMFKHRRFKDMIDVFTHADTDANALSREIQSSTGVGIKTTTGLMYATHEDINIENELFDEASSSKLLSRLNAYAETGARLTATVSLINPITDTLQLWAARAASQRIVDVATGKAKFSQKWLNDFGLTSGDLADIKEIASHMKLDADGTILRWNSEKQRKVSRDHADAYDRFLGIIRREVTQTILETSPNAIKRLFSGPTASVFLQLKTYMLNSLVVNTASNIKLGPANMAASLVSTSIWGAAVYAAQTFQQSVGRDDQKEFLAERLTPGGLMATGFSRSPDASIFPMLIDTIASGVGVLDGEDHRLFSNSRTSGLGSGLFDGVPAVRTEEDLRKVLSGVAAAVARTDQHMDQSEWRGIRDFIPLMKTYLMLNATNALISTAPGDTDGAIIKSGK